MRDTFLSPPADQGFGSYLLHAEPDRTLAIFVVSWLPRRGAPPHDHGTWGVVCGVKGVETNINWLRTDDQSKPGQAELREDGRVSLGRGDIITVTPKDIHSVINETDEVTLSFHIYGRHLNETGRNRFDVEQKRVEPFIISVR
ncbi:cysteine dioxygenase family protein [Rhodoligotrophos ferricapiens]|uniref:cysteine dioxygenase family protein n=1 Tax=Rhodoligotrophos ferricapiens TaxID=3069264 RepID=UPI00315D7993